MRVWLFIFLLSSLVPSVGFSKNTTLFAFATLETSMGEIELKLYKRRAPQMVANFVGLADGSQSFRDVNTGQKVRGIPFYQKMIFHKVHPQLGIQTGCPWGNGRGRTRYTLKEEKNDLKFDRPFLVAMAKVPEDPSSVGSQFFITTQAAPHLDKDYTVMGEVIRGSSVVLQISRAPTDDTMKPLKPISMNRIRIEK